MAGDQTDDAVRVHEVAAGVRRTDAVGVAVGDEGGVETLGAHEFADLVDVRRDRLGVQTAEAGIELAVDLGDFHAEAAQRVGQVALARTVERVDRDLESGSANRVAVDHRA